MPTPVDTRIPRLLVLHRVQGAWSAVSAQQGLDGLEIEACSRVQDAELSDWVAAADAASVRVVLPGAAVVCRTVALGDETNEALLEQQLLNDADSRPAADTPMHRSAVALLPAIEGTSQRTGVVLSWPTSDTTALPDLPLTPLVVPDITGLLQLADDQAAAAWLDGDAGSIALMLQGRDRMVARCIREADPESSLSIAMKESSALTGSADPALPQSGALRLNDAARTRLTDLCTATTLPDNLDHFGIAIACAAACTNVLAPLTVLQASAPKLQHSRSQRAMASMRTPRTAAALIAVAIAVLFIAPVLINGLRLTMLRAAHPELGDAVAAASVAEARNQYYRVLGTEAWPMTKLLSDIGAAAPLGIVLEQIRIDHGEPIRIKGYASPRGGESAADLITRMKADLQASGVFDEVRVEWDGKKRIGQREFTIVAGVRDAKRRPRYQDENDYAAWTHQQRRHTLARTADGGPPARPSELSKWDPAAADRLAEAVASTTSTLAPTTTPSTTPGAVPVTVADAGTATGSGSVASGGRRPGHRPSGNPSAGESVPVDPSTIQREGHGAGDGREHIDRPGGSGTARDSGSASVGSAEFQAGDLDSGALGAMPQILTNEQLAALSEDELRAKLSEVTQARERIRDPEQSALLRDYFKRIFDRLRELRRNGSQP